ncbi:MAG TPA: HAMP domain-containing sensor histidine kinase [Amaricoccus sp.]|uniref:sensor histidine kinase n=1 Tax=Amaricoccus sp. TaxID=1872485 RepID=UPI002CF85580|nr:HAMP domain-containing sensor histidine kinase [Amaricoccus sp.]HMQ91906.1 HAMP domain-containing sensor histidine kinase [Amaricoccus sp.]HMR51270.1 HAMP domain-containing sensor histidine kinase [Amaricoccus sp.]HMT98286.1 HAMP domain-containing sensor histidine kinase [Amaricoccus sp.]
MAFNTLSGRFLGLTIVFVVIAEVLIFVPSVSRFRVDYLETRLDLGQLAALALLATPDEAVSDDLEQELLQTAEVLNVALQRDEVRELVLSSAMPKSVDETFDLRGASATTLMRGAVKTYFTSGNRIIRVIGTTRQGMEGGIEVTLYEAPLRAAMVDYGLRILYLSLAISVATAALLFFAVRRFIVRPIQRVIDHMTAYRDNPEDSSRIIQPGRGSRELVEAETALRDMQLGLTGALRQKERLAALGGAVAKISHDLRNMLTTTQLLADRIESSSDPAVRRTAPKLVNSLARAISLCERTLTFGKVDEPAPEIVVFPLAPLVGEVLENEREASATGRVAFRAEIAGRLAARADPDQLFRVLTNLVRNAAQAIEASGRAGSVTVSAGEGDGRTRIRVADTGPGLPPKARENLFRPFSGGVRQGGTGLGLVIAAELVKGHGGSLTLDETAQEGTTFVVDIPAPK